MSGSDPLLSLELSMLAYNCSNGMTCDFSNTGSISFGLPQGVSFTSDSGVFLTAATPVPATLPLLAGGLGMIGLGIRRKRKVPAAA